MKIEDVEKETALKQYEVAWRDIWKLDEDYLKITMLYIALISAYIGTFKLWAVNQYSSYISIFILAVAICIIGIIYCTRKLLNQRLKITDQIEDNYLISYDKIYGIGKIRTSTYLTVIVAILTILAVFLTLKTTP
jgi:hypothetical protein